MRSRSQRWAKPGVGVESEYGVFFGVGVDYMSESEWSRSLEANLKIGTKNDASLKF